jgi:hypothetical protein
VLISGQPVMSCKWRILSLGADVMLPVVHLIPRLSLQHSDGVPFQTIYSATISFDEEKKEWIVETPSTLSHVSSPDLSARPERRVTIPNDGGSFLLRLLDQHEPRALYYRK